MRTDLPESGTKSSFLAVRVLKTCSWDIGGEVFREMEVGKMRATQLAMTSCSAAGDRHPSHELGQSCRADSRRGFTLDSPRIEITEPRSGPWTLPTRATRIGQYKSLPLMPISLPIASTTALQAA